MSRTTKRLWLGLGLLLMAFVSFTVEEAVRGHWELGAWQRAMRAKGERYTIGERKTLPSIGRQGRGLNTEALSTLLHFPMPLNYARKLEFGSLLQPWVGPGQALVIWPLEKWGQFHTTNSWAAMERAVQRVRPQVSRLRAALTNRAQVSAMVRQVELLARSGETPRFQELTAAAATLALAATVAEHDHHRVEAIGDLQAALALLGVMETDHLLVMEWNRVWFASIFEGVTWELLQAGGWTDTELAALQVSWTHVHFVQPMAEALEHTRALATVGYWNKTSLSALEEVANREGLFSAQHDSVWPGWIGNFSHAFESLGRRFRRPAFLLWWRCAWREQDELYYDQSVQRLIEACRRTVTTHQWQPELASEHVVLPPHQSAAWFVGRHWFSLGALVKLPGYVAPTGPMEMRSELTVTAIALKRYQLRHGDWPVRLTQLVPDFLSSVPRDWFSGRALRYRRLPRGQGRFLLYSVGPDGHDDGGVSGPPQPVPVAQVENLDLVWPQPATSEVHSPASIPPAGAARRVHPSVPSGR